jgi:hypothetical protein
MRVRAALALCTITACLGAQTPSAQIATRPAADDAEHALDIDNERVRIYRIRLEPGDSIPVHTHPRPWVSVTIVGPPAPGASAWHEPGEANPIAAGTYPLEVVEIELK